MSDRDPYDGIPSGDIPFDAALANAVQLAAMFSKLDAYGQRVLLAQAAAMLRVQAGA